MLEGYFKQFPGIKDFQSKSYEFSIKNGYIITDDYIRRKIFIEDYNEYLWLKSYKGDNKELKKKLKKLEGVIFRDSANYPIQSTAATMTKLAMIYMRERNIEVVAAIHDEVVVLCKLEEAEKIKSIVENCMAVAGIMLCRSIAVTADAKIVNKWSK